MARLTSFSKKSLEAQGFGSLDDAEKARYALALRFSPALGTVLVVIGLALRSPLWIGAVALVALSGALWPRAMLLDLVYNLGVRHLFGAPPLPPTPAPRRFSYVLSTALLAGCAVSLHAGLVVLAMVLGGFVVLGGTVLSTTLFCLGSLLYRLLLRKPAAASVAPGMGAGRTAGRSD